MKNYVYLQCEMPTMYHMKAKYIILCVKDMLSRGILLLEGKYRQEYYKHSKNYIPCHIFIYDSLYFELEVVSSGFLYFICGKKKGAKYFILISSTQSIVYGNLYLHFNCHVMWY